MRSILFLPLLIVSAVFPASAQNTPPALVLHVEDSQLVDYYVREANLSFQQLEGSVSGRHVRLISHKIAFTVLALGDYPVTLSDASHPGRAGAPPFDLNQEYVLTLPDGTRRVYRLVGLRAAATNP